MAITGKIFFIFVDVGQQCGLSETDPVSCHVYVMFRVTVVAHPSVAVELVSTCILCAGSS